MERVIAIVGPTAVGKTKLSIGLAKKLQTEIISGDSMLVYQGLDIGTAKPPLEERAGIPHHLIDILKPDKEFSVADFQVLATKLITDINHKNKIPILAGGTGLYVKALLEGYQFNTVTGSEEIRQTLVSLSQTHGNDYLHAELAKVLPETAARLHPNDQRRIIRALEIYQLSGQTTSCQKQNISSNLAYDATVIGITLERQELYSRIDQRVDLMIAGGWIDEVSGLLAAGVSPSAQAMQGIGYKEIAAYLKGEIDLPAAIIRIKQATRNFAKRQMTWFRKMPYIEWVTVTDFGNEDKMLAYIYNQVAGKFKPE